MGVSGRQKRVFEILLLRDPVTEYLGFYGGMLGLRGGGGF